MLESAKIPATIVTGFLGSGKTTLLHHILDNADARRIAVIVNEFAEVAIDGELLEGCLGKDSDDPAEGIYELANGCLCCTVQDDFFWVMHELASRREHIDHILIETSGLALPQPLVQAFNRPDIQSFATVDAVITVVDGYVAATQAHHKKELTLPSVFDQQLAAADLVILNKTDLLTACNRQRAFEQIQDKLSSEVDILEAQYARLDLPLLLDLEYASEAADERSANVLPSQGMQHDHTVFNSVVIDLPEISQAALQSTLVSIVAELPVYRIKGFVAIPDMPMRLVVQGVGERLEELFCDRRWDKDESRMTRLVMIGLNLDPALLQGRFHDALAAAA